MIHRHKHPTMKNLQMVDLRSQYRHIRRKLRKRLRKVIKESAFINGSEVKLFQQNLEQYLGVRHVIPCASGTEALQIALMALPLEEGDEVIIPDFTFVSAAEVACLLGLRPVFVDIDPQTFVMNPAAVERAVTERTRVIVPTHLFGQCTNMSAVMEIAEKYGLYVIEDACQSLGADYILREGSGQLQMGLFTYDYRCADKGVRKKAGTIGHIGCTSFFPSKNLGCYGDGGAIFTDDDDLAARMRQIANHGSEKRYSYQTTGLNSRLDSVQAAVLNVKLPYLNSYNARRQEAAAFYDRAFISCMQLKVPVRCPYSTHIFHQYCLLCRSEQERKALQFHLQKMGIPTKIYYPKPLHLQEAFRFLGGKVGDFPVSEDISKRIIAIPMHTELSQKQLRYISAAILNFFN